MTSAANGEPDEAGRVSSAVRGEVRASALMGLAGLAMDSRSWEAAEERLTEVCACACVCNVALEPCMHSLVCTLVAKETVPH